MPATGRSKPRRATKRKTARRRTSPKSRRRAAHRRRAGRRVRPTFKTLIARWRKSPYARAGYALSVASLWAFIALGGLAFYYAIDLPDTSNLWNANRQPTVTLIDRNGETLLTRGSAYGLPVTIDELPPHLPQAVIATEDRRFYHHVGVDFVGLARAAMANWQQGRVVQGGSTITQQLAKILFLTPERKLKRKIQELMLALWLEQRFTKDQILSLYLNRVYLGAGTYGVEAASQRYFGKSARDVDLAEAAILAGLLKAPSRYAPTRNAARSQDRADTVLLKMVEAGFITDGDRWRARKNAPVYAENPAHDGLNYFADWALAQLPLLIGDSDADLIVETTIDRAMQDQAEKAVALTIDRDGKTLGFTEAALVTLSPEGAVRAMVGGRSYRDSQFNRAVDAKRQPGSAFKPFVYLTALEFGYRPGDLVEDAPIRIGNWSPKNFSDTYRGSITLTEALSQSINTVAVRLSQDIGNGSILAAARRLGIKSPLTSSPSLPLGASEVSLLELTAAYGPFANNGYLVEPHGIVLIKSKEGGLLYQRHGSGLGRVVSPDHVAQMNFMLKEVMNSGTGRKARLDNREAAGKTGTSQDNRDAWFIGYTADYLTGVWVGNDNNGPMGRVTGGRVPTVIWKDMMLAAHKNLPPIALPGSGFDYRIALESNAIAEQDRNALSRFFSRIFSD